MMVSVPCSMAKIMSEDAYKALHNELKRYNDAWLAGWERRRNAKRNHRLSGNTAAADSGAQGQPREASR